MKDVHNYEMFIFCFFFLASLDVFILVCWITICLIPHDNIHKTTLFKRKNYVGHFL